MFTSLSIYFFMMFLIFWAYCGYLMVLCLFSIFSKSNRTVNEIKYFPSISILVPCFNEEDLIEEKVRNILSLDYPQEKLNVYFMDGCSTDKTVERLREEAKNIAYINVIETKRRGKINQINYILPKLTSDIVVSTDMDALLEKNVLIEMIKTFDADPKIAVVGACISPRNCIELESQYWDDQNRIRILESRVYSSSIVVAPCYAYRRSLISNFPDDCIADDIYIAFLANSIGLKSKYIESAIGYETRTPQGLDELLNHKFRKGNAYIMELLRFLYKLPHMPSRWKFIYMTKFLQLVIMPWIIPFFVLSSISLILTNLDYMKIIAFSFFILFMSLLLTSWLFSRRRKYTLSGRYKRRFVVALFFITSCILLANGITYPFYSQTSTYDRINGKRDEG